MVSHPDPTEVSWDPHHAETATDNEGVERVSFPTPLPGILWRGVTILNGSLAQLLIFHAFECEIFSLSFLAAALWSLLSFTFATSLTSGLVAGLSWLS